MYTRSDNVEIMFGDDNDDIIKQLFESLLQKYEENLQNKMKGSEFEFDGVNFLYYDFNKTSINRGGSYIDSPKWLKDKKSIINPKNNDDKCFQYAVTLALNLDKIKKNTQRVSKIKPFIEKYNWDGKYGKYKKAQRHKVSNNRQKRSKLVSEPNYHTINLISEDLSKIEMKKKQK